MLKWVKPEEILVETYKDTNVEIIDFDFDINEKD
jgi:hypothetical protein